VGGSSFSDISPLSRIRKWFKRIDRYSRIVDIGEISRRYFVINSFDGALSMIGVILGAKIAGIENPLSVIWLGLSIALTMGISGFSGAYIAEKAERTRYIKEMEAALATKLTNSILNEACRTASFLIAVIDALSPVVVSLVSIIPFVLAYFGMLTMDAAVFLSLAIICALIFLLGAFLGRISRESWAAYGLKMLVIGLITAAILVLVEHLR